MESVGNFRLKINDNIELFNEFLQTRIDSMKTLFKEQENRISVLEEALSIPQYIMTDMQKYLAGISVFRCRSLGLFK